MFVRFIFFSVVIIAFVFFVLLLISDIGFNNKRLQIINKKKKSKIKTKGKK